MDKILRSRVKNRNEKELSILQGLQICYYVAEKANLSRKELRDKLKYLNTDAMQIHLQRNFTNVELMDAIFCMFDTTMYMTGEGLPNINEELRNFIDRLHKSEYGSVSTNNIDLDIFMIKTSKDHDNLLHEFFIGSLFTNRLRAFVPNFAYVFAGFKTETPCSSINRACTDDNLCPCDTPNNIDYIIYEKIDGVPLGIALKSCNFEEYLSWMIQIFLSLEVAVTQFGFTHYNLHTDNVYIRTIKRDSDWAWIEKHHGTTIDAPRGRYYYIPYYHDNKMYLVKSSSIATIWNYEFAHVKHTKRKQNITEHFGAIGYSEMGIYENEARPFYDVFKILMWSLNILFKYNKPVFQNARKISKFFGYEYQYQLVKALEKEEKTGYMYNSSISDLERTRSIADLINIMFDEFPEMNKVMINKNKFNIEKDILSCNGFCPTTGFHVDKLTGDDPLNLFINLKDIMERYKGLEKRDKEIQRLCSEDDEECIVSNNDLETFRKIIERNKYEFRRREIVSINILIDEINQLVTLNNRINIDEYLVNGKYSLPPNLLISLYRRNKLIKSKLQNLSNKILTLEDFDKQFNIKDTSQSEIKPILESKINKMLDEISDYQIKELIETHML